jgi:hypothetical protein
MIQPAASVARAASSTADPREHALLRLDAYSRYGEILAAQLAALAPPEPDLERFNELTRERAAVAREIDDAAPLPIGAPEIHDLVHNIRERIHECRRADAAVLERLSQLRHDTGRALHAMDGRKTGRAGYLATEQPDRSQLDVKL